LEDFGGLFNVLALGGLTELGRLLCQLAGLHGERVFVSGRDLGRLAEIASRLFQAAGRVLEVSPLVDVKGFGGGGGLEAGARQ
jgi:hypothetical protein